MKLFNTEDRVVLDFTEEIARGAAWLDAKFPGWHNHINTKHLDLADTTSCILGQVWSTQAFAPVLAKLRDKTVEEVRNSPNYGFHQLAIVLCEEKHYSTAAIDHGFDYSVYEAQDALVKYLGLQYLQRHWNECVEGYRTCAKCAEYHHQVVSVTDGGFSTLTEQWAAYVKGRQEHDAQRLVESVDADQDEIVWALPR